MIRFTPVTKQYLQLVTGGDACSYHALAAIADNAHEWCTRERSSKAVVTGHGVAYHVKLPKLCSALAGVTLAPLTPSTPLYLGLALLAALGALEGCVQKVSEDEACIVQPLCDAQLSGHKWIPEGKLREHFGSLATKHFSSDTLENRFQSALRMLKSRNMLDFEPSKKEFALVDYILVSVRNDVS